MLFGRFPPLVLADGSQKANEKGKIAAEKPFF